MKKLLLFILPLVGLAGGVGAGLGLRPTPEVALAPCGDTEQVAAKHEIEAIEAESLELADLEFLKLANQFVVPVVHDGAVSAMVVMSLSLEVFAETRDDVHKLEPKLRDKFLQVMFEHANVGGFSGDFTNSDKMAHLRVALTESAAAIVGDGVRNVLITDIVRQDI